MYWKCLMRFLSKNAWFFYEEVNITALHLKSVQLARICALMSRIEHKYCLISTSYLTRLFDIFKLLHIWQNCVRFGDFLPMKTLCDACHKEFEYIWLAFNPEHICMCAPLCKCKKLRLLPPDFWHEKATTINAPSWTRVLKAKHVLFITNEWE